MITAHAGIDVAVEAMKRGATDFVSKPWSNERLLATVRTAAALAHLARARWSTERKQGRGDRRRAAGETPLLGDSPAMARVCSLIERAAPTDANVLILGENGTGKELVARELHRRSRRADQVAGLGRSRRGRRESVRKRTVRPCEGRLHRRPRRPHRPDAGGGRRHAVPRRDRQSAAPPPAQAADRAGAAPGRAGRRQQAGADRHPRDRRDQLPARAACATKAASARICCSASTRSRSTCRPCASAARTSSSSPTISSPIYAKKYGKPAAPCPATSRAALEAYDWPGNVRALRHACERAVILADGDAFTEADFSLSRGLAPRAPRRRRRRSRRPRRRPQPRARRKADGRGGAEEARLQHLARRRRARPDPRLALSADGKAWALSAERRMRLEPLHLRPGLAPGGSCSPPSLGFVAALRPARARRGADRRRPGRARRRRRALALYPAHQYGGGALHRRGALRRFQPGLLAPRPGQRLRRACRRARRRDQASCATSATS